ncbi:MAG: hypothetical protein CMC89_05895 [Flavobacteriaceae bacterium]|nr:hypothetical protein [Flavobacteriaceae bacterium]|tara:strand:- start:163 stop:540 length:378 start_codon:yes stop_codon:yes gene_type:complete
MIKSILYISFLLIISCDSKTPEKIKVSHISAQSQMTGTKLIMSDKNLSKISFQVDGMTCKLGCAARIEKKVSALQGIITSTVDFEAKTAYVSFDPATTSFDNIKITIESLGDDYKVGAATIIPAF